ncbi:hypothetical protein BpHYR1_005637 [Brachionus plicatilis]|uniref:Uncharacterized protein n=1 Tax=Brachionus plicatilis TaxID=10195 RepID=A0A3M7S084_BRAPC|nr:hypothetical protein BpHYR1_005637 [Brachionus plicatilis]
MTDQKGAPTSCVTAKGKTMNERPEPDDTTSLTSSNIAVKALLISMLIKFVVTCQGYQATIRSAHSKKYLDSCVKPNAYFQKLIEIWFKRKSSIDDHSFSTSKIFFRIFAAGQKICQNFKLRVEFTYDGHSSQNKSPFRAIQKTDKSAIHHHISILQLFKIKWTNRKCENI